MPVFKTSHEWLQQSALLLEARPSTTRITTKYSISPPPSLPSASTTTNPSTKISKRTARASIELKTYDPASGTVLKYRTTKAAEVSRLVLALGTLGREMAALPKEDEGDDMLDVPGGGGEGDVKTREEEDEDVVAMQPPPATKEPGAGGGAGGGGGKKKKKKGKK